MTATRELETLNSAGSGSREVRPALCGVGAGAHTGRPWRGKGRGARSGVSVRLKSAGSRARTRGCREWGAAATWTLHDAARRRSAGRAKCSDEQSAGNGRPRGGWLRAASRRRLQGLGMNPGEQRETKPNRVPGRRRMIHEEVSPTLGAASPFIPAAQAASSRRLEEAGARATVRFLLLAVGTVVSSHGARPLRPGARGPGNVTAAVTLLKETRWLPLAPPPGRSPLLRPWPSFRETSIFQTREGWLLLRTRALGVKRIYIEIMIITMPAKKQPDLRKSPIEPAA